MANLQHGHTFTEHAIRDPAAFNANVDAAMLNNVGNADLTTGVRLPTVVQPGSPITGEVYVNDAQDVFFFGQKRIHPLQFFYGGIWNDQAVDTKFLTLTNNSAVDLTAGCVVFADPTDVNGFIIPTIANDSVTSRPLGVLLDDIATGASGRVAYYGVVLVNVYNIFGSSDAGFRLYAGDKDISLGHYHQDIATAGTSLPDSDGSATSDGIFGMLLGDSTSALGSGGFTGQGFAFIWK
jgi:hypothetical protein